MDKNDTFNKTLNKYTSNNKYDIKPNDNELLNIISSIEERYIFTIYGLFRNIIGYFKLKKLCLKKKNKKYGLK